VTYLDDSANRTLDNANEGIMSSEFDEWYWNLLSRCPRVITLSDAFKARQPEIDALKANEKDHQRQIDDMSKGYLAVLRDAQRQISGLKLEVSMLKAENERLREDAEQRKAEDDSTARYTESLRQEIQRLKDAAMKDFSTTVKEEER
jgi:hypothetical protein